MTRADHDIRVCHDSTELGLIAAALVADFAAQSINRDGMFTMALCGGRTPITLYTELALPQKYLMIDWSRLHLFWGDERYVPLTDPESNYRLAEDLLISKIPIPSGNVHPFPMSMTSPEEITAGYEEHIKQFFNLSANQLPRFGLVLLGLGEDGHTASLFPESTVLYESSRLVVAPYVKKSNAYRLTLTFPVINNAAHIVFLVAGREKADVLLKVINHEGSVSQYPACGVKPTRGTLIWIVDQAAASKVLNNKG